MAKNEKCAVTDSMLCKWIDRDCSECQIDSYKHDDDRKKALEDFEVTISLLPDDIDDLMGDECQFCRDEKRKRDGYALVDFAHSEPKSETGMFFGLGKKVRRKVGSLMPLSIAICGECRRSLRLSDLIKWIIPGVLMAVAIVILMLPSLRDVLSEGLSLVILLAALLGGYLIGKAASAAYVRVKSRKTRFNVFEIPVCEKMKEAGWFTMQDDTPVTRFIFSRKPHSKLIKNITGCAKEGAEEDS